MASSTCIHGKGNKLRFLPLHQVAAETVTTETTTMFPLFRPRWIFNRIASKRSCYAAA